MFALDRLLMDKKKVERGLKNRGFTPMQGSGLTKSQIEALKKRPDIKALMKRHKGNGVNLKGNGVAGAGFWDDVWKGIKKTGMSVDDWLKKTKVISKGARLGKNMAPIVAVVSGNPEVAAATPFFAAVEKASKDYGYGKKIKGMGHCENMCGKGSNQFQGASYRGAVAVQGTGSVKF